MNISRGLFRLWVIFTTLFIFSVIILNLDGLKHSNSDAPTSELILPVKCTLARGQLDKDYSNAFNGSYCWYEIPAFRNLFPEYKDLPDPELSKKLFKEMNRESGPVNYQFWNAIYNILVYGLGIPILLLALGVCLKWAFAGFKNS